MQDGELRGRKVWFAGMYNETLVVAGSGFTSGEIRGSFT